MPRGPTTYQGSGKFVKGEKLMLHPGKNDEQILMITVSNDNEGEATISLDLATLIVLRNEIQAILVDRLGV